MSQQNDKSFLGLKPRALPELDGIRFFAISLVLLHHVYTDSSVFMEWMKLYGWVGVDLFFVMSGFLITTLLIKEKERTGKIHLKMFWIRRIFRLWPSWFLVLAIATPMMLYLSRNNPDYMYKIKNYFWLYFVHLANYSNAIFGGIHTLIDHYWSLALEEHFYLLWPLLLVFTFRYPKSRPWVLLLLLTAPYFFRVWHHSNATEFTSQLRLFIHETTHTRLDSLAWGCLLAFIQYKKKLPSLSRLGEGAVLFTTFFVFYISLHHLYNMTDSPWLRSLSYTGISFASCLAIWLCLKAPERNGIRQLLRARWLGWCGVMSYGAYLVHPLTNTLYYTSLKYLNLSPQQWVTTVCFFTVPYLPAAALFYLVDQKFERYKNRFRPSQKN